MKKSSPAAIAAAFALAACSTTASSPPHSMVVAPAPISFDGHVAGQAADYVFVLDSNADPAKPGFSLRAGDMLKLAMPRAFKRNDQVPIKTDADTNLVMTKGWPQGAVKLAGQYELAYDAAENAMLIRATQDIGADGANAPGIKVIHLRGRSFLNPDPGDYPVSVTHIAADKSIRANWSGSIKVLADPPSARLAPTNFHLPPGSNADFQKVGTQQQAPHYLGLLLWGEAASSLNKVGVAPRDLTRFPKYTGGLLIQDSNGDHKLDPASDKVVGGIIGAAPQGATGQAASSPLGADGKPILSGEIVRHTAYPPAAGGGKPNPGLLPIQFKTGSKPGRYRPTVELIGGNSYQFTIEAAEAR